MPQPYLTIQPQKDANAVLCPEAGTRYESCGVTEHPEIFAVLLVDGDSETKLIDDRGNLCDAHILAIQLSKEMGTPLYLSTDLDFMTYTVEVERLWHDLFGLDANDADPTIGNFDWLAEAQDAGEIPYDVAHNEGMRKGLKVLPRAQPAPSEEFRAVLAAA